MDKFFQSGVIFNSEGELIEFLLRRYTNIDYIMSLDIGLFMDFIIKAIETDKEEKIRSQWVQMLPYMCIGQLKYMSFNDYKKQCLGQNIDRRPTEEILAEIDEIERIFDGHI